MRQSNNVKRIAIKEKRRQPWDSGNKVAIPGIRRSGFGCRRLCGGLCVRGAQRRPHNSSRLVLAGQFSTALPAIIEAELANHAVQLTGQ
jgi:hypothetical protein